MKLNFLKLILIFITIFQFTSCNKNNFKINDFKEKLKELGYNYTILSDGGEGFFITQSLEKFQLDNEIILVYEFNDPKKTKSEIKKISTDGKTIGSCTYTWDTNPHFYYKKNIIVQYMGNNKKILNLLNEILGKQVAGSK